MSDNATPKPIKSFTGACLAYFGKKPGQTMGELSTEIKQLTDQDRKDLTPELERELDCVIQ